MRQKRRMKNGSEFTSNIVNIRAIEDCIRATNKYTKGIFRRRTQHPIQGEDFPSRVLNEYYEVYPDTELSWDMPASEAWAWVWGDVPHYDVWFTYDYRTNKASVIVKDGVGAVKKLAQSIPNFSDTLARVIANGSG